MKKSVGAYHKVIYLKATHNFPNDDGAVLVVKLSPKSFQIDPKCFQKVATEILTKNNSMEFSND